MKNEIRMAVPLPSELEEEIFDIQGEAIELLDDDQVDEAVEKIWSAWHKLPEPKFNTSCSDGVLTDLVEILTIAGQHQEAESILNEWIKDTETSGYKILNTTPFILLGETYLFLDAIDKSKVQFYKAVEHGATARDFSEKPPLYFDIARKKIVSNDEIQRLFEEELVMVDEESGLPQLAEAITDKINDAAEAGNEFMEEDKITEAIDVWKKALKLIPDPQNTYSESLWFEVSIGDAYFLQDDFASALPHFENAKGNIGQNAYENPFIMLRLGQLHYEATRHEEAKEYLLRAYMIEGEEIFENDDPKYFDFLKTNVDLAQHD